MQTIYRVIWIDDTRDPFTIIKFNGSKHHRFMKYLPSKFSDLSHDLDAKEFTVIWLKSYSDWTKFKSTKLFESNDDICYIDCYCFDHDLGSFTKDGTEKTGLDIAKELTEELSNAGRGIDFYECHSSNPAGKENILSWLRQFDEVMGY